MKSCGVARLALSRLKPDPEAAPAQAIARIEADEQGTDEDFEHLSEYVRMVVLNVYAQLMLEGEDSAPAPSDNVVAGLFQGRGRLH